ncbi:MAG: hypothetical protein LC754_13070 [Acidobacteria bacterium]|nr:hypothetical protein [Acidobacteriota bacterium]
MPDEPVVIKGGSVEIDFNPGVYIKDPANPKKHSNANQKITSVEITDDNTGQVTTWPAPGNGKCTIKINTR